MSVRERNDVPLIKIPLAKSCYLLLTASEYRRGLTRGKVHRRREQHAHRRRRLVSASSGSSQHATGAPSA